MIGSHLVLINVTTALHSYHHNQSTPSIPLPPWPMQSTLSRLIQSTPSWSDPILWPHTDHRFTNMPSLIDPICTIPYPQHHDQHQSTPSWSIVDTVMIDLVCAGVVDSVCAVCHDRHHDRHQSIPSSVIAQLHLPPSWWRFRICVILIIGTSYSNYGSIDGCQWGIGLRVYRWGSITSERRIRYSLWLWRWGNDIGDCGCRWGSITMRGVYWIDHEAQMGSIIKRHDYEWWW